MAQDALEAVRKARTPPTASDIPAPTPSLAGLAKATGRGIETGAPVKRTFTGGGAHEVPGDPTGKYWWDGQQQKWRVAAELPPGYTIKPVKR